MIHHLLGTTRFIFVMIKAWIDESICKHTTEILILWQNWWHWKRTIKIKNWEVEDISKFHKTINPKSMIDWKYWLNICTTCWLIISKYISLFNWQENLFAYPYMCSNQGPRSNTNMPYQYRKSCCQDDFTIALFQQCDYQQMKGFSI